MNINKIIFILYRKKYGIQFFLDIIRQYYAKPDNLTEEDGKSVRLALLEIIKYYIQRELSIKEVCFSEDLLLNCIFNHLNFKVGIIVSYVASVKYEYLVIEMLELLISVMTNKNCKDQIFLLLHEPQTAELLYALLVDKNYGRELREIFLKVCPIMILYIFLFKIIRFS